MESIPKITVGLPTYNRADLLKECLGSILSQSCSDFEVVVSDNCSTDSTSAVMRAFRDPRIRYYRNQTNIGPIANMNRCLDLARGRYLVIAHDDDLYAAEFLARAVKILEQDPTVGMVHCATCEIDANAQVKRLVRAYDTTCVLDGKKEFLQYLKGHNVCCSTVMVPRHLYVEMGGLDTRYMCWDWLMWLRLALRYNVAYIAEPLVGMRVHGERVSARMSPEKWYQEFVDIFQEACDVAVVECPEIIRNRAQLACQARQVQSRRFFVDAMHATALGDFACSREYVKVLQGFKGWGWPRVYAALARILTNRLGQALLLPFQRMRRYRAKRRVLHLTFSGVVSGGGKFS